MYEWKNKAIYQIKNFSKDKLQWSKVTNPNITILVATIIVLFT